MQPPEQQEQVVVVNGHAIATAGMSASDRYRNMLQNKRLIGIIAGVSVLLVFIVGGTTLLLHKGKQFDMTIANVQVTKDGFTPSTVLIEHGQGVTWTNKDLAAHQVFADQTAAAHLDSVDVLLGGDSYTYVFEKPGTYYYYDPTDTTHFQGTVIVQ